MIIAGTISYSLHIYSSLYHITAISLTGSLCWLLRPCSLTCMQNILRMAWKAA